MNICLFIYLCYLLMDFFPALLAMLLYGHDSNVTKLLANLLSQAICILLFCQLYFVILFQ